MALTIGELVGFLRVDDSDWRGRMDRAKGEFEGFADGATRTGRKLTTRVTLPLVGLGGVALKMGGDFEESMNKVAAITGATGDDLDDMAAVARELGSTTAFSASEAADALAFLGMAGFDAAEASEALPGVLQLAAASGLDLAQTADVASNILSGFGLDVADLSHLNDVLAHTTRSANTDLQGLGEAMKFAAPTASAAGLSIEETAAAIGLMGDAGIQGGLAGRGLNSAIASLLSPSSEAASALERLGVQVHDSNGEMRGLADIMADLEDGGADVADMMQIFGREAGPKMQALLGMGSDALRDLTGELEGAGGTAEAMADKQMEGLNGALKTMQSAFEGLMIAIAESGLIEWGADLVNMLAGWLQALSQTNPALLRVGVIVGGVVAAVGPLLLALGTGAKLIGGMLGPLAGLTGGVGKLGGVLKFALGPWGLLIGLIVMALMTSEDFRDAVMGLVEVVMGLVGTLFEALLPVIETLIDALVPLVTTLADALAPILVIVVEVLGTLLEALLPIIVTLLDVLAPILEFVAELLGDVLLFAAGLLVAYFERVLVPVVMWLADAFGKAFGWIGDMVARWWQMTKANVDRVIGFFRGLPGRIRSGLARLQAIITAPFKAAFNMVARLWNNTVGRLSFSAPSWVPGIGGKGFSMPQLPMMARGGDIRRAGAAIVGEAGPELLELPTGARVTPLDQGAAGGGGGGRQRLDIVIRGDGILRGLRERVQVEGGDTAVVLGGV